MPAFDPGESLSHLSVHRPNFKIRQMLPADIQGMRSLIAAVGGITLLNSETDQVLQAAIERNRPGCVVAHLENGIVIGCSFGLHDGLRGSFRHVAVDPQYHRRGIATDLLDAGYQYFRSAGLTRIIIQVGDKNKDAIAFWIKQGFRLSTPEGGIIVSMTKDMI